MKHINNLLITGSNGFVGKYLCKNLGKYRIITDTIVENNTIIKSDITKKEYFDHFITNSNIDTIIHLAAKTSISESLKNPFDTYYNNILGTLNILNFAKDNNVKNIIFLSTYVYGKPIYLPIDENHPVNPHSPYNKSKVMAEQLCEDYSRNFNINIVVLRPFYLYGYNTQTNSNSLIPSILRQITSNKVVRLSNKDTSRDFLFIYDFIDLINKILINFPIEFNIYNVGSGTSYTITEISNKIANLLDTNIKIQYDNSIREDDIINMIANITKVSKKFNWKPKISIDKGLESLIKLYNQNLDDSKINTINI